MHDDNPISKLKLSEPLRAACGLGVEHNRPQGTKRQIEALIKRGLAETIGLGVFLTDDGRAVGREWINKALHGNDWRDDADPRTCPTCNGDRYHDDEQCGSCSGRGYVWGPPPL